MRYTDTEALRRDECKTKSALNLNNTRTAWAVFKYCGTKTATLGLI
jgi:hypothetical protein